MNTTAAATTSPDHSTRAYVEQLIKSLVDEPEAVVVTQLHAGPYIVLEIDVSDGDRGLVIGRDGRMLKALRMITTRIAAMRGQRVMIQIKEPEA